MRCQGRPDGKCPDNRNDNTVHNTMGDLLLCDACEEFRWPSARTTRSTANKKKSSASSSSSSSVYASTQESKGVDRDAALTVVTQRDKEEAENLISECSTCLLPVDRGDENGLICNICSGYHHLKCINATIPISVCDAEQIINVAKLIGWVCHECTVQSTTKLNNLQSAVNTLFEEVNKLKIALAAAEATPSLSSTQPATAKSKKEMVSEVSLVVHQTLNDKARRRCNVVISGLFKPDEVNADSNNLADRQLFNTICEQYLEVKPALSNKGCVRLGRHEQSRTRPRKLLVHLNSETSASDLLRSSRCLRRHHECANIYINPDLSPAESKIAYEQRKRRRDAVLSRVTTAGSSTVNDRHQLSTEHDISSPAPKGISSLSINAANFVPTSAQVSTK